VPLPVYPLLLYAGAAAFEDPVLGASTLLLSVLACTAGNLAWFWAGQRYGRRVLSLLCRITLSPDACVRQTESIFERYGASVLLIAKFFPGLATVAPPLTGAFGLGARSFLLYNTAGAALWAGSALVLGVILHNQIDWLFDQIAAHRGLALLVLAAALACYAAYRWLDRLRFFWSLRAARISVGELHNRMSRGRDTVVLDARTSHHRKLDARRIPGARAVDLDDLERTLAEIPRSCEVVVYCACPNDAATARVALQLRRRGFRHVRPLTGGLDAWANAGLEFDSPIPE
jgi:membrane protein DedA with SNARE-associated domain/rhodanese-related sulfurtransferase